MSGNLVPSDGTYPTNLDGSQAMVPVSGAQDIANMFGSFFGGIGGEAGALAHDAMMHSQQIEQIGVGVGQLALAAGEIAASDGALTPIGLSQAAAGLANIGLGVSGMTTGQRPGGGLTAAQQTELANAATDAHTAATQSVADAVGEAVWHWYGYWGDTGNQYAYQMIDTTLLRVFDIWNRMETLLNIMGGSGQGYGPDNWPIHDGGGAPAGSLGPLLVQAANAAQWLLAHTAAALPTVPGVLMGVSSDDIHAAVAAGIAYPVWDATDIETGESRLDAFARQNSAWTRHDVSAGAGYLSHTCTPGVAYALLAEHAGMYGLRLLGEDYQSFQYFLPGGGQPPESLMNFMHKIFPLIPVYNS